jgi:hypothetical protein
MNGREVPTWEDLLTRRDSERANDVLGRVNEGANELVQQLRGDDTMVKNVVAADALSSMLQWFSGDEDVDFTPGRSGAVGVEVAGAEWTFRGVHDIGGAFRGLPATGREVEVHGFTILSAVDDRLMVTRHIDWAGLFAQLGLGLDWRVPLRPEPDPPEQAS